jgi:hypothetical protein
MDRYCIYWCLPFAFPFNTFHNPSTKTKVLVIGILFHTKADVVRAIGIEYREQDSSKAAQHTFAEPQVEYYLYGGVIHSPQLLKVSGIGDASSHCGYAGET